MRTSSLVFAVLAISMTLVPQGYAVDAPHAIVFDMPENGQLNNRISRSAPCSNSPDGTTMNQPVWKPATLVAVLAVINSCSALLPMTSTWSARNSRHRRSAAWRPRTCSPVQKRAGKGRTPSSWNCAATGRPSRNSNTRLACSAPWTTGSLKTGRTSQGTSG